MPQTNHRSKISLENVLLMRLTFPNGKQQKKATCILHPFRQCWQKKSRTKMAETNSPPLLSAGQNQSKISRLWKKQNGGSPESNKQEPNKPTSKKLTKQKLRLRKLLSKCREINRAKIAEDDQSDQQKVFSWQKLAWWQRRTTRSKLQERLPLAGVHAHKDVNKPKKPWWIFRVPQLRLRIIYDVFSSPLRALLTRKQCLKRNITQHVL